MLESSHSLPLHSYLHALSLVYLAVNYATALSTSASCKAVLQRITVPVRTHAVSQIPIRTCGQSGVCSIAPVWQTLDLSQDRLASSFHCQLLLEPHASERHPDVPGLFLQPLSSEKPLEGYISKWALISRGSIHPKPMVITFPSANSHTHFACFVGHRSVDVTRNVGFIRICT